MRGEVVQTGSSYDGWYLADKDDLESAPETGPDIPPGAFIVVRLGDHHQVMEADKLGGKVVDVVVRDTAEDVVRDLANLHRLRRRGGDTAAVGDQLRALGERAVKLAHELNLATD